jgi:flagellar protein FliS
MNTYQPYQKYKNLAVNTLSPTELLVLLYEQLDLNLNRAVNAVNSGSPSEAHRFIMRAQDIVMYLVEILDMRYPISRDLLKLYGYLNDQLIRANSKKDPNLLSEIRSTINGLKDIWKQADTLAREKNQVIGEAI